MDEIATTVRYQLTIEDFREMVAHVCAKARPGQALAMLPVMALVFVATYNLSLDHSSDTAHGLASGMLAGTSQVQPSARISASTISTSWGVLSRPGASLA